MSSPTRFMTWSYNTPGGEGSGFSDQDYGCQGARIVPDCAALLADAELVLKVKEPSYDEAAGLSSQHTLFAFLHLAAMPKLAERLAASGATCLAYETVRDARGRLPLLEPMSEIAGRLAAQAAALTLAGGPNGQLLAGAGGASPARVVILVVGLSARTPPW